MFFSLHEIKWLNIVFNTADQLAKSFFKIKKSFLIYISTSVSSINMDSDSHTYLNVYGEKKHTSFCATIINTQVQKSQSRLFLNYVQTEKTYTIFYINCSFLFKKCLQPRRKKLDTHQQHAIMHLISLCFIHIQTLNPKCYKFAIISSDT